jgi:hypothetical protein
VNGSKQGERGGSARSVSGCERLCALHGTGKGEMAITKLQDWQVRACVRAGKRIPSLCLPFVRSHPLPSHVVWWW